jgi:hypothetical protein
MIRVAWRDEGTLRAEHYDQELAYFRQRYFADGDVTYHFHNLHLRNSDRPNLVRSVMAAIKTIRVTASSQC